MTRITLSDTLTALIEGATPDQPYLRVEEAEVELAMIEAGQRQTA